MYHFYFTCPSVSKFLLKHLLFSLHIDKIGKIITRDRFQFFMFARVSSHVTDFMPILKFLKYGFQFHKL